MEGLELIGYKKLTNKDGKKIWVNIAEAVLVESQPNALLGKHVTQILFVTGMAVQVQESPERIFGEETGEEN